MRYGLEVPNAGVCDARTLGDLAALAEASGWDGIFLEDYIIHWAARDVPTYDPWVALATMALQTEHIRIGTTVTPLSRRRPWKVARETVTLDHLSGGRMVLGVGLGDGSEPSFAGVGEVTDLSQRAGMVNEAIDVVIGLWSGQSFSYDGKHYQVRDVTFRPTPVQTPRIPIWVGGGWPHMGLLRRAARCDGICPYKHPNGGPWQDLTPDEIRGLKVAIEGLRTPQAPFDIAIGGRQRAADWDKEREHIRSLAEAGATWWMEGIPPGTLDELRAQIERGPLRIA